jgi:hypothetical protein
MAFRLTVMSGPHRYRIIRKPFEQILRIGNHFGAGVKIFAEHVASHFQISL